MQGIENVKARSLKGIIDEHKYIPKLKTLRYFTLMKALWS